MKKERSPGSDSPGWHLEGHPAVQNFAQITPHNKEAVS